MESSSVKETQRKIKSETNECENVVKLEPEIKTEEDIKIKLEPNGKELDAELENGLKEIKKMRFINASCGSNPKNILKTENVKTEIVKIEFVKTESFDNRKELDEELENGLNEMEKMDFTVSSSWLNPRNLRKRESSSIKETQVKIQNGEKTERENFMKLQPEIKTGEGIKLEPNDKEDSQNELHELIWLDSNLVVEQEFEEKEKTGIVETESSAKGQLISECLFAVLNFPKN